MKSLFWTKLLHTLSSVKRIINVGGCWLMRTIKQNYSWFSRGISCKIHNIKCTESMLLLSEISREGLIIITTYSRTVNSNINVEFFKNLFLFIDKTDSQRIQGT